MPGLSQLKKFNEDILNVGDEVRIRTLHGEKPIQVPIPENVQDIDDSEDFIMGLPEEGDAAQTDSDALPETAADDGLDDIFADLDDSADGFSDMPDLSGFDEPLEAENAEIPGFEAAAGDDLPAGDDFSLDLAGLDTDGEAAAGDLDFDSSSDDLDFADSAIDLTADLPDDVAERGEAGAPEPTEASENLAAADNFDFGDLPDLGGEGGNADSATETGDVAADFSGLDLDLGSEGENAELAPETGDLADDFSGLDLDLGSGEGGNADIAAETSDVAADFSGLDLDLGSEGENAEVAAEPAAVADDFSGLDLDLGSEGENSDSAAETGDIVAEDATSFDNSDFDIETDNIPLEEDSATASMAKYDAMSSADLGDSDLSSSIDNIDLDNIDLGDADGGAGGDSSFGDLDLGLSEGTGDSAGLDLGMGEGDDNADLFNTDDMAGMDFSAFTGGGESEPSGEEANAAPSGDFDNFEIPGFSDTDTVKDVKPKPAAPVPPAGGGATAKAEERSEPNTLTDAEYEKFLKNLSGYPLNVRIAVEDMFAKDEFTDEVEFDVVEKVLNKVSAKKLANHLEKLLDISIPVPRDFERRTAEEYEALKSSFEYQLKNRIIPLGVASIVALAVIFGLFQLAHRFIYKPIRANIYYSQGYALIESNDYPQSEILFDKATTFDLQKKWFYKYARGYRERKQYDRAEKMYRNILNVFNYDKQAGLEYADMESRDRANYEKAVDILLRDVLDHYVNDPEGMLALGDVYLEWATERDPTKFELAREQYSALLQLNKDKRLTNLYLSRMLRYFIRTDNLYEVLTLKNTFMAQLERNKRRDPISGEDWTELGGYLFDKLFGPLTASEEYLRRTIEDVPRILSHAVITNSINPVSSYNLGRYHVQMNNSALATNALKQAVDIFGKTTNLKTRDIYKYIDSYRLLGEEYVAAGEDLLARETYTQGINLYHREREASDLPGTPQVGLLFADMGDIDYFVEGDNDNAYRNYVEAINLGNDIPQIRYKVGYIDYYRQDYDSALNSFLRSADAVPGDDNLLLALGNTLMLRGNTHAAEGYYSRLVSQLDLEKSQKVVVLPQVRAEDQEFVSLMERAWNNYGVALYDLSVKTGDSRKRAQAIVQLSSAMRAYDALTRNQETFQRIGGSNLAKENIDYLTKPVSQFEPNINTDLPRTLSGDAGLGR